MYVCVCMCALLKMIAEDKRMYSAFFVLFRISCVSMQLCVCVFSFLSACCCCLLGVLIFLSSTVDGWHCSLYSHRCYTQMTAVSIPISLWILQCETDNEAKATKTTTKLSEILQKNWIIVWRFCYPLQSSILPYCRTDCQPICLTFGFDRLP